MYQYISPKVLKANGRQSPCYCSDDGERQVTCHYCVQANLILEQRREGHQGVDFVEAIRKTGIRETARAVGVSHVAVQKWLRRGKIPARFSSQITRVVTTEG